MKKHGQTTIGVVYYTMEMYDMERSLPVTLLILSDSHGRPDRIQEAIRRVRPDGILFCGDGLRDLNTCELPCPLYAVSGNCDWLSAPIIVNGRALEPETEELVTVEGVRILLIHGHTYHVKSGLLSAVYRAMALDADLLVFGHTHLPLELHLLPEDEKGLLPVSKPLTLFNPGSLGDRNASFGTVTIRNGQLLCGHGTL